jgi:hypothetical protein
MIWMHMPAECPAGECARIRAALAAWRQAVQDAQLPSSSPARAALSLGTVAVIVKVYPVAGILQLFPAKVLI